MAAEVAGAQADRALLGLVTIVTIHQAGLQEREYLRENLIYPSRKGASSATG